MSRNRRQKGPLGYADLHRLGEDERIGIIGKSVMEQGLTVAVCVDSDPPEKADRYIAKLRERFPGIVVLGRADGPTPGAVTVRVGPPSPTLN